MFVKIINKTANRGVFITLAVSFVWRFSLLLFAQTAFSGAGFSKITDFTVFVMKFGFFICFWFFFNHIR